MSYKFFLFLEFLVENVIFPENSENKNNSTN